VPFLGALATEAISPTRLFLDLDGAAFPLSLPSSAAALLVGPEGGWAPEEREAAHVAGWQSVALPAGKLRTETAAIAGLILLLAAREARK
ncbi:MAG TPA: 16S rRNA (uracil(1498)-N(3))-methyltransferase, partial [Thermoanaerobaculia bacterium]|nr:16S rRNA (uracil(1498)-N(3))-methyltransferase [Thermoanaerobaculia bacterium]